MWNSLVVGARLVAICVLWLLAGIFWLASLLPTATGALLLSIAERLRDAMDDIAD